MKTSRLFRLLKNNDKRIMVLQGGTGSSKTYSTLQYIIVSALSEWENETIDIVRRTTPALTRSAMKDFEDILKMHGLYNVENHNKTQNTYKLGSNLIRFYSSDDEHKIRGARRDRAYLNEVLEFKEIDVNQILMRTNKEIIMDYNPSEEFHWVYDNILTRDDVNFHVSTFKDNPFLDESVRKEILKLKHLDPNLWKIYGEGERGSTQGTIFTNWEYSDETFDDYEGQEFFGLDFGFNDPTVLVRGKVHDEYIYIEQLIYKTGLTDEMLKIELDKLKDQGIIDEYSDIIADSSRPDSIEYLSQFYNVKPAKKGPESILKGINFLKTHKIFLDKNSIEMIKEFKTYRWKTDKNDKLLDKPVDVNNHAIDATRYGLEKSMGSGIIIGSIGGR